MQALFAWLDITFIENFQNQTATVGALDMGGQSTQIALQRHQNKSINTLIYG